MTRLRRILLQVEVGLCFAPLVLQLLLGLLIAPLQIFFLFTAEPRARWGALAVIALIVVGLCGLVALHGVMTWLLYRRTTDLKPRTVAILASIGFLPLLGMAFLVNTPIGVISVFAAIGCSIHLLWLARDYLFSSYASPVRP